jgi:hypothetical protein
MTAVRDECAQFKRGFARSKRGNLWRTRCGRTVCIFARSDGSFAFSVAGPDGPKRAGESTQAGLHPECRRYNRAFGYRYPCPRCAELAGAARAKGTVGAGPGRRSWSRCASCKWC